MTAFFPKETETRLVQYDKDHLIDRFEKYIKPIENKAERTNSNDFLFNGVWNHEGFSISLILRISNNFIPIIHGKYLNSNEGTLLQLTYEMFPATKKLLLFWTVITMLITIFFIGLYQAWLYGAISFGFCLVNYILSRENFKNQVRKSKRMIEKMLS
jgi:hypothetical protein